MVSGFCLSASQAYSSMTVSPWCVRSVGIRLAAGGCGCSSLMRSESKQRAADTYSGSGLIEGPARVYVGQARKGAVVVSLAMSGDEAARLDGRFAKLWAASTVSALGSGLATVAAPLYVASRTTAPFVVSAAFAVAWLPWLLFALPGGVLVDRVDRRRLMVTVDWIRVVAMGVLAAAILTGWASVALLYVVLFVVNTGEIVFRSASQAMIPALVPPARLERANGWLTGGATLAELMVAGPLGAFLFVVE